MQTLVHRYAQAGLGLYLYIHRQDSISTHAVEAIAVACRPLKMVDNYNFASLVRKVMT